MSNTSFNTTMSGTTDVAFRSWGSSISTALAAVGLVQTSDTGQINWTTVSKPSGATTTAGYEIWRFNDAAQSTTPIFLKLSYGTGSAGNTTTRLLVEIGSASNGSGTLSGLGSGTTYTFNGDASASGWTWGASDGSGFVFCHMVTSANGGAACNVVAVDRLRNADGTPSGDGLLVVQKGGSSSAVTSYIHNRNASVFSSIGSNSLFPAPASNSAGSLLQANGEVMISPHVVLLPSLGVYYSKMLLSYPRADIGSFGDLTVNHLGAARKYRSVGPYVGQFDAMAQAGVGALTWWSD